MSRYIAEEADVLRPEGRWIECNIWNGSQRYHSRVGAELWVLKDVVKGGRGSGMGPLESMLI
jgi:hypothetical protein